MYASLSSLSPLPSRYTSRNLYPCLFGNHPREPVDPLSQYHPLSSSNLQDFHECMEHLLYKQEYEEWLRQSWELNLHRTRGKDSSSIVARLEELEANLELCARVILLPREEPPLASSLMDSPAITSPSVPADLVETVDWKPDGLKPGWKRMCLRHELYHEKHEIWLAERQTVDGGDEVAVDRLTEIIADLILYAQIILLSVKRSVESGMNDWGEAVQSVLGKRKRKRSGRGRAAKRTSRSPDEENANVEQGVLLLE